MSEYSGVHIIQGEKAIWLQGVGYVAAKPIEQFRKGDIIAYNYNGTGIFISKKEVSPKFWEITTKGEGIYSNKVYHRRVKKGTLKPYYKPRKKAKPKLTVKAKKAAKPPKPPAGSGLQMQSSFGGGGGQTYFTGASPKKKGKTAAKKTAKKKAKKGSGSLAPFGVMPQEQKTLEEIAEAMLG